MPFWNKTIAAPRWIDTIFPDRTPRYLRLTPPDEPAVPAGLSPPVRLTTADAAALAAFWRENYGDEDWYMDATADWVDTYLRDTGVIVLAIYCYAGDMVGTIVSTPFSGERTLTSNGGELDQQKMRVIEGLCISKKWRSKGIAGYLIGIMDCWTSRSGPVSHLWSRELPTAPLLTTAISTDVYGMVKTRLLEPSLGCEKMAWTEFVGIWNSSATGWVHGNGGGGGRIVATKPVNRANHLDVWIIKKRREVEGDPRKVVVVLNTRRRAIPGDEQIYEVVWCGYLVAGRLLPNGDGRGFRPFIESVGSKYPKSILFVSSGRLGGEARADWPVPWRFGRSGVHSWHIYNYMPPAFGGCEIIAVREEI